MFDKIEEALIDLQNGKVIIVCDDEDRENEGDFVSLAEKATPEVINLMATHGRGLICVPVDEELAQKLELFPMVAVNTDVHGTAFTVSIDHKYSTTGISAFERSATVLSMLDPESKPSDFKRPGHIFPLVAKKGGVLRRTGHTEAAVDLARLCGSKPAGVICEIMNEDGTMARVQELRKIANELDVKMITIKDLIEYRNKKDKLVKREAEINLPTEFGEFKAAGYSNVIDGKEHLALIKGEIDPEKPILVRVHSECLTGDVFGSYRCECRSELHAALSQIEKAGNGVLLYMRQGSGLINKLREYQQQEENHDTVEADENGAELREFGIGAQILKDLGISKMKLLTNNPRKIKGIKGFDLEVVETVALQMEINEEKVK
ncbi:bifunctional 3,4-dihydroxy-2-butanone-4-phosphate synthase/GTP cyclohydrolase II [Neobacillus niacini]|uniref:bifunctional 3,4-dihydroxy-2-butanone-4-phosphate synthase/GTP cyclohydrolase II n=1 Tax=Neobacillus niacini TaxID=86668 RepID=UPI0007ABE818|nr:bifunctional 3,4-dihydroxy-2-butanone-4-phosphate synthase/GTP cyclohydrolase II [Neobacillus niacini]MEC1521186.1 bifunctional 3,4-dihydroxy-2-butanone-4-phosphate synthase/GTP cyclohydrolase II [Neobacillus niacini]